MEKIINIAKSAIGIKEEPLPPVAPPADPKIVLARNKIDAESKLKNLVRKEETLQAETNYYRNKAKIALQEGNDREYNINNSQFKRASGGLKMASAAVDSARSMIGIMESQESVGDIMEIASDMSDMQGVLGIDPDAMKDAAFSIRQSVSNSESISEAMNSITEMVSPSTSPEIGDPLKAELMAEIQAESAVNGFGDKISDKLKELE